MASKYSDEHITPGAYAPEFVVHSPELEVHYNASDQVVKIRKLLSNGEIYVRQIVDPDVTDYVVDRVVTYSRWKMQSSPKIDSKEHIVSPEEGKA